MFVIGPITTSVKHSEAWALLTLPNVPSPMSSPRFHLVIAPLSGANTSGDSAVPEKLRDDREALIVGDRDLVRHNDDGDSEPNVSLLLLLLFWSFRPKALLAFSSFSAWSMCKIETISQASLILCFRRNGPLFSFSISCCCCCSSSRCSRSCCWLLLVLCA